jgi:hypothetical protein
MDSFEGGIWFVVVVLVGFCGYVVVSMAQMVAQMAVR